MKYTLLTLKQIIILILKAVKEKEIDLICEYFDCIIPIKLIILQIQKSRTSALVGCSCCLFYSEP